MTRRAAWGSFMCQFDATSRNDTTTTIDESDDKSDGQSGSKNGGKRDDKSNGESGSKKR